MAGHSAIARHGGARSRVGKRECGRAAPSILSSFMVSRKHDDIWLLGVPELKRVGEAWVNQPSDMWSYVSSAPSMSSPCMPMATRMYMCCGRSAIWPFSFSR